MSDFAPFDPRQITGDNGQLMKHGSDAAYAAEFYINKLWNFDGTDYKEVPHLKLRLPGTQNTYDQPAIMTGTPNRPSDPERFPVAWTMFHNGREHNRNGTPLSAMPGMNEQDAKRFEFNGILTVEQLACVPDAQLGNLGLGARTIRDSAIAFMQGTSSADPEKAEMRDQIAQLKEMVMMLAEQRTNPDPAPEPAPETPTRRQRAHQEA